MDEIDYNEIKAAQADGMNSLDVAFEFKLDHAEVNIVFFSSSYDEYVKGLKKGVKRSLDRKAKAPKRKPVVGIEQTVEAYAIVTGTGNIAKIGGRFMISFDEDDLDGYRVNGDTVVPCSVTYVVPKPGSDRV